LWKRKRKLKNKEKGGKMMAWITGMICVFILGVVVGQCSVWRALRKRKYMVFDGWEYKASKREDDLNK